MFRLMYFAFENQMGIRLKKLSGWQALNYKKVSYPSESDKSNTQLIICRAPDASEVSGCQGGSIQIAVKVDNKPKGRQRTC